LLLLLYFPFLFTPYSLLMEIKLYQKQCKFV
jgi:hypothetical protein